MTINRDTLSYLSDLDANNDREWFAANRSRFEAANGNAKAFLASLVEEMNRGDAIVRSKVFRIYRDVRFSEDKSPYKPYFAMSMGRRKPDLRGGYYLEIRRDGASIHAGFFGPEAADLARVRTAIDDDGDRFRALVESPQLERNLGPLTGSAVKTAPRGYRTDHPHIDLLRHKQFIFSRTFDRDSCLADDFAESVAFSYRAVRPFFDYMSRILTT